MGEGKEKKKSREKKDKMGLWCGHQRQTPIMMSINLYVHEVPRLRKEKKRDKGRKRKDSTKHIIETRVIKKIYGHYLIHEFRVTFFFPGVDINSTKAPFLWTQSIDSLEFL